MDLTVPFSIQFLVHKERNYGDTMCPIANQVVICFGLL